MNELTKEHWSNICRLVTIKAIPILKIGFNTRLRSEIISSLFEIESANYYKSLGMNVRRAITDHDPDLFFEDIGKPVEIKVTKERKTIKWMGNNISKRSSDFILVVWNEFDTHLKFYITKTYLTPDDWKKSKKNYNASFLNLKDIKNKTDLIYYENYCIE